MHKIGLSLVQSVSPFTRSTIYMKMRLSIRYPVIFVVSCATPARALV